MRPAIEPARQAALATAGRVLLDRGKPAFVYYSALCGGIPALASEVWPGATDYRPAAAHDDACARRAGMVERAARRPARAGASRRRPAWPRLRDLRVVDRTTSRRAGQLRADGFSPPEISAHELRMAVGRTLGWQLLRSTAFEVTRTAGGYRFRGVGYGHGVGLCVIGAGRRAARGESAEQILRAYFGPLTVSGSPPEVTTPAAPPAARPVPRRPLRRSRPPPTSSWCSRLTRSGSARRSWGWCAGRVATSPARPACPNRRGSPSPSTRMSRASAAPPGSPGGSPPPPSARRSTCCRCRCCGNAASSTPRCGTRSRTSSSTRRWPAGPSGCAKALALYFSSAGGAAPVPDGRPACPSDAELLRAVSAGAQREAYSRAERCVRRRDRRRHALGRHPLTASPSARRRASRSAAVAGFAGGFRYSR